MKSLKTFIVCLLVLTGNVSAQIEKGISGMQAGKKEPLAVNPANLSGAWAKEGIEPKTVIGFFLKPDSSLTLINDPVMSGYSWELLAGDSLRLYARQGNSSVILRKTWKIELLTPDSMVLRRTAGNEPTREVYHNILRMWTGLYTETDGNSSFYVCSMRKSFPVSADGNLVSMKRLYSEKKNTSARGLFMMVRGFIMDRKQSAGDRIETVFVPVRVLECDPEISCI